MPEHDPHDKPGGQPHDGYEKTDAELGGVVISGVVLAVGVIAVLIAMVVMYGYYSAREGGSQGVIPMPPSRERGEQWPASPRLEGLPDTPVAGPMPPSNDPPGDYGWVDEKQKIVRIPVAAELPLAVKKLSGKAATPTPSRDDRLLNAERTQPPSAANSGRILPPLETNPSHEGQTR
jgi:hypothetical protein